MLNSEEKKKPPSEHMEEPWLTVRRYPPYITTKLVAAFIYKSLQLKKKPTNQKNP